MIQESVFFIIFCIVLMFGFFFMIHKHIDDNDW